MACSGLAFLSAGVACGGRTSALDANVYDGSVEEELGGSAGNTSVGGGGRGGSAGSGGRHPTATAGKPAGSGGARPVGGSAGRGGRGGAGGQPSAGAGGGVTGGEGGNSGPAPTNVLMACLNHCSTYGFVCGESATTCPLNCQNELDLVDPDCRAIGLRALACVDAFFTTGASCAASATALQACGGALDAFHTCKGSRIITPIPRASPGVDVTACSSIMSGNAVSCKASFSCVDGDYNVFCAFGSASMRADCSCQTAAGVTRQALLGDDGKPCYEAARALCR